jgi:Domain of unknown function (DUF4440)
MDRVNAHSDVVAAARARADALAAGDARSLNELLHPDFRWTSHTGEQFDRAAYIDLNTGGQTSWQQQNIGEPEVIVVADAAVLRTTVTDLIDTVAGPETYRMPMTQFWVHGESGWQCLAGHAGPRLT